MNGSLAKISSRAALVAELHCLSEDGLVVLTAQHWREPAPKNGKTVAYLRLVRNGRPYTDIRFAGARRLDELTAGWAELAGRYEPTGLTDQEMWSKLRDLAHVEQDLCARRECGALIPVGRNCCPACFRSNGRVVSGALSGTRRYGDIAWDLRRPV